MKRVRIMLIAIGGFAVVGGTISFKLRALGMDQYCTRTNSGQDICTSFIVAATFDGISGGTQFKYNKTTSTANCTNGNVACAAVGRLRN